MCRSWLTETWTRIFITSVLKRGAFAEQGAPKVDNSNPSDNALLPEDLGRVRLRSQQHSSHFDA